MPIAATLWLHLDCDKNHARYAMASMLPNIPVIFVSGGPMRLCKIQHGNMGQVLDLIDQ